MYVRVVRVTDAGGNQLDGAPVHTEDAGAPPEGMSAEMATAPRERRKGRRFVLQFFETPEDLEASAWGR